MSDLRTYATAVSKTIDEIDLYVRDTDDGPGWSILLDIDRTPAKALGWLAQFVGVTLDDKLDDTAQRQRIRATDGFRRGSPAALKAAAQQHLTGNQTVEIFERDGSAYALTVITLTAETPDPALVEAALRAQKPAALILTYLTVAGQIYQDVLDNYASYEDVLAAYATYQGVYDDAPGT